jgi:hypothetical protein
MDNEGALPPHANPRLKLSYRQFSISNLDQTSVSLRGGELDVYPLSRRWVRAGAELEAGGGRAALNGVPIDLRYGMLGAVVGFQYPDRITPFVDGRIVGGVMGGSLDHEVLVPGTSVTIGPASAATWILGRGIDVGAEVFAVGRVYVSGSLGWLRTTWHGVDYDGIMQNPDGGIRYKDLTGDSLTFKLGLGI